MGGGREYNRREGEQREGVGTLNNKQRTYIVYAVKRTHCLISVHP